MAWRKRYYRIPLLVGLKARYELHMKEPNFDGQSESSSEYSPEYRVDDSFGSDDMGPMRTAVASDPEPQTNLGPCLYLGPAGQRCYRPAVKGGFCAQHQPGATAIRKAGKPAKWVAAIGGIVGVLWPYIYDFLHELFRIFHPR